MLNASTARSFTSETLVAKSVLSRRFDFGFRMDLMRKDVRLFLTEAEHLGVSTFMASVAKQFFDQSIARGHGGDDMTNVVRELEQLAGVETAAVENSAFLATRPQSTYKTGKVVQTSGATST